jgi:hypothetical protein
MKAAQSKAKGATRFESRWGRAIAGAGYSQTPDVLIANFHKLGLAPIDLCILLVMLRYAHPGKPTWLSKGTIAAVVGIEPRSVQRRISAMEKRHLVRREARAHRYGDNDTNLYHLDGLAKALEPYAKAMLKEREAARARRKTLKPDARSLRLVK